MKFIAPQHFYVENNKQESTETGDHYKELNHEPIDVMTSWLTHEQIIGFCLGNCIKYISRFNMKNKEGKGGIKDLKKAKYYAKKIIDEIEKNAGYVKQINHHVSLDMEPDEVLSCWLTTEQYIGFNLGSCINDIFMYRNQDNDNHKYLYRIYFTLEYLVNMCSDVNND